MKSEIINQITIEKIAEYLPPGQLLSTCEHVIDYDKICQDANFWKKKIELDYGIISLLKLNNTIEQESQWKDLYVKIYENKIYPFQIIYNDVNLGSTYWIPGIITLLSSLKLFLKDKGYEKNINELIVQIDSNSIILKSHLLWNKNSKYDYIANNIHVDEQTRKVIIFTHTDDKDRILDLIIPL